MTKDIVFNHDGFGLLSLLTGTSMTESDAAGMLVTPLVAQGITVIDWSSLSTAHHNCRTRHNLAFDGQGAGRRIDTLIGQVIQHYNRQELDLLDIVVKHGHEQGIEVFGNLRLNHSSLEPDLFLKLPGRNFQDGRWWKKDFRDPLFHGYLQQVLEDILAKNVDGITLDFERKAPFFPPEVPEEERLEAVYSFLRGVRSSTGKKVAVRVAHAAEKGRPQGQDPVRWMTDGLVDVVIPATHNHEPDDLQWPIATFLEAAAQSPRPCRVWPQIWPTGQTWGQNNRHSPTEVRRRAKDLVRQGAHGVYFFNFCCDGWPTPRGVHAAAFQDIFADTAADKERSEATFGGLAQELNEACPGL